MALHTFCIGLAVFPPGAHSGRQARVWWLTAYSASVTQLSFLPHILNANIFGPYGLTMDGHKAVSIPVCPWVFVDPVI